MKNVGKIIPRTAMPIGNEELATALKGFFGGDVAAEKEVANFENDLARYLGVKKALAFNSGRTALYMALQALELRPGEKVIVPAYICAIVFEVVLRLGLKPVLVDVNPDTCNINSDLLMKAITSDTRAVVPAHLFGRPCEMDRIMEIADKRGLYVIEDAAQALGAEYKGIKVGTFGDVAFFSFGPGKSMTCGEGGAMVVNNSELEERLIEAQMELTEPDFNWTLQVVRNIVAMRFFSNPHLYTLIREYMEENLQETDDKILENCLSLFHHKDNRVLHKTVKLAKMPRFSAKIARTQLKKLDMFNEKRISNATMLSRLLNGVKGAVELPEMNGDAKSTFTRYPVKIVKKSRDELARRLIKEGIDSEKPYNYLVGLFQSIGVEAPSALTLTRSLITIPNHPLLESSDLVKIAKALSNQISATSTND